MVLVIAVIMVQLSYCAVAAQKYWSGGCWQDSVSSDVVEVARISAFSQVLCFCFHFFLFCENQICILKIHFSVKCFHEQ